MRSIASLAVAESANPKRISVLQFRWEHRLWEVLEADGAGEAIDRKAADGGETGVGCGGIRAPVNHGVCDFDAGGKSVEDDASCFLLEDMDEFAIGGEILFIAEDGGGEMAGEGAGSLEVVLCRATADKECMRAEDLVGKVRLSEQLVERNGEELCVCVEWLGSVFCFRR